MYNLIELSSIAFVGESEDFFLCLACGELVYYDAATMKNAILEATKAAT